MENARRVVIFTADQERVFLQACDAWQFPLFLTLMLTGLRPGELTHLLLPDDLLTGCQSPEATAKAWSGFLAEVYA